MDRATAEGWATKLAIDHPGWQFRVLEPNTGEPDGCAVMVRFEPWKLGKGKHTLLETVAECEGFTDPA